VTRSDKERHIATRRDKDRQGETWTYRGRLRDKEKVKHSDRETSRRWIQRKRETDIEIETSSD